MALDKRQQAFLFERCREALGEEGATLLMNELPPNGWENVATKQDIELLQRDLVVLEHKLTAAFERGLRAQTKWFMLGNAGTVIALVAYFSTVR